jgi:hypothetical protein
VLQNPAAQLVSELFESFKAKSGGGGGGMEVRQSGAGVDDKDTPGGRTETSPASAPLDFKAGLRKVASPTPEAAKSAPSLTSAASQQPPSSSTDFKSQLKKTSKSSNLYGPAAAADTSPAADAPEVEAAAGVDDGPSGFLFKSQLRKVGRPTEEERPPQSQPDQFRSVGKLPPS